VPNVPAYASAIQAEHLTIVAANEASWVRRAGDGR
jgi:hypothetical protein